MRLGEPLDVQAHIDTELPGFRTLGDWFQFSDETWEPYFEMTETLLRHISIDDASLNNSQHAAYERLFQPINFVKIQLKHEYTRVMTDNGFQLKPLQDHNKTISAPMLEKLMFGYDGKPKDSYDKESRKIFSQLMLGHLALLRSTTGLQLHVKKHRKTRTSNYMILNSDVIGVNDNTMDLFNYAGRPYVRFKLQVHHPELQDRVFYLMSRGIPRDKANMLVAMPYGYLDVDWRCTALRPVKAK